MQTTFFEGYGFEEAFDTEWDSFAAWVLRGEPPVLTGEDGLRAVEIMQAALHLGRRGRQANLAAPGPKRAKALRLASGSPALRMRG